MMNRDLTVGMLLFPGMTQLDLTGPYEVFCRMPNTTVSLLSATTDPVRTEWGLTITPDCTFADTDAQDILCVPGGWGVNEQLANEETLAFLRAHEGRARYLTAVCSGSLILGAAGLLKGYRATTHWMSHHMLHVFGADPVEQRVVVDRDRITGGGVTAGIDFGLVVAAKLFGQTTAEEIQLAIEYQPAPPFHSGLPGTASAAVRDAVLQRAQGSLEVREDAVRKAAARLG
ncbi:MAG: DJ-1/PfpI family protein [Gemmatimonadaceae bacterium]